MREEERERGRHGEREMEVEVGELAITTISCVLPNARGQERSDVRVRTMIPLVPSVLAIRVGSLSLRSLTLL